MSLAIDGKCEAGHKVNVSLDDDGNIYATVGVVKVDLLGQEKSFDGVCPSCATKALEMSRDW